MELSGKTRVCCVIGDPIGHTLSPLIHNAAFKYLKLDFVYVAFRVRREELENAVKGMRSLGVHGFNVTMPHKNAITKYLDELDSTAKFIGSVNTVLNENGKLLGFNTDGVGALKALKENHVRLNGEKLLLLGAGGAAQAIAFQLASEVKELAILNRDGEKAKHLANALREKFGKKVVGKTLSAPSVKEELKDAGILVNATSVGMHPNTEQSLVNRGWLRPDMAVMDIVYNPVETKLIKDAKAVGAKVVYGTEMLVFQGAASFEIWCKRPAPIEIMRKIILKSVHGGNAPVEGAS
ncbi:MAG: shikimate dehydrogenase [Candidatus Bathyarchaeales archaeon]